MDATAKLALISAVLATYNYHREAPGGDRHLASTGACIEAIDDITTLDPQSSDAPGDYSRLTGRLARDGYLAGMLAPADHSAPVPVKDDNPYERACARYNRAEASYRAVAAHIGALVNASEAEFEAARAELRQYETSPGIPLPQYEEHSGTPGCGPGAGVLTCRRCIAEIERRPMGSSVGDLQVGFNLRLEDD